MKRKAFPKSIFLLMITAGLSLVFLFFSLDASAQVRTNASPVKALEYSLKNLYDSANEVSKKNKWLKEEIHKMDQEYTFLRAEMRSLESSTTKKRISTALDDRELMKDIPWEEERINMMYEDYIALDEEHKYLQSRLEGKKNDQQNIEADVNRLGKEVSQLTKQKNKLLERYDKKRPKRDISRINETLKRSEKSVRYAQKKLKRLENKYGAPLKEFNKIKDRNIELKGRVAFLSKQKEMIEEEKQRLNDSIMGISSTDKDKLTILNDDIAALRAQKRQLKEVVDKASQELGEGFTIPDYKEHIEQVRGNISTIKDENQGLKKELDMLRAKIQDAQTAP